MSNCKSFAERELEILSKTAKDPNNRPIIEEFAPEIIALCEKFGKSGQSGGSAPYTASALSQAIKKLCLYEPIAPLTGEDDEWTDISKISDEPIGTMYQNKRCSALFKDVRKGRPDKIYYIDALIKKDQSGDCWSGSFWLNKQDYLKGDKNLMVGNAGIIKSFPFEPKTFYIDVINEEVKKDDWESFVADPKQLEEFYEYYVDDRITTVRRKKLTRILNEIKKHI